MLINGYKNKNALFRLLSSSTHITEKNILITKNLIFALFIDEKCTFYDQNIQKFRQIHKDKKLNKKNLTSNVAISNFTP